MVYEESGARSGVMRGGEVPVGAGVVTADSLCGMLLPLTAAALARAAARTVGGPAARRGAVRTRPGEAVPAGPRAADPLAADPRAADPEAVDPEAVAAWIVGHYGRAGAAGAGDAFPAVVIGSPHGAAAHLAATLGAPWLPAGFEVSLPWPGGAVAEPVAALDHGLAAARRLMAAHPGVAVRQVHDPVLRGRAAGTCVTLMARWRRLPSAYRDFLAHRLAPGAPILLVQDARAWPVFDFGGGATFQLGSPAAGLEPEDYLTAGPDLRQALRLAGGDPARWCPPAARQLEGFAEAGPEEGFEDALRTVGGAGDRPVHTILYPRPSTLSAAVAEVVRGWLAGNRKADDRLVVECGRLLDPGRVLRAGLVPYWCESALRTEVSDAEWWLAGSPAFATVDVLVDPPGRPSSVVAPAAQWNAVAWFGSRRGSVDRAGLRGYPYGTLPAGHASVVLGGHFDDLPLPAPLEPAVAVDTLTAAGAAVGLLVY